MHRLPRCSPDVPIQYRQWTIPRNVSPSSLLIAIAQRSPQWLLGARRNVSVPDAHRSRRLPGAIPVQSRSLAWGNQPLNEKKPCSILQRLAQLLGDEVS